MINLEKIIIQRRIDILDMVYSCGAGHVGGSLSSIDIVAALHYRVMNIRPGEPDWPDRDRFILSKGHSVEGYYTVLADLGFFPREELRTYCQCGTRLLGHPTRKVPGVEMNTGALGHGLSVAAGMALAGRMKNRNYRAYVLMGDGEQAEGSIYEAAMAAGHYGLDHLTAIIDRNGLQISGPTEQVMGLEPLREKWEAFRWNVLTCDGNDVNGFVETVNEAQRCCGKPTMIIANTVKGKGVSFMENNPSWHHGVPNEQQYIQAKRELKQRLWEVG